LEHQGIVGAGRVHYNLIEPALVEAAIRNGEGRLGKGGAFLCTTGQFTGRSPKDKFVVRTPVGRRHDLVGKQRRRCRPRAFAQLKADMLAHVKGRELFVQDLYAGADPVHRVDVRMVTELAWHGLFIRHLLRRPAREELDSFAAGMDDHQLPSFKADPKRHGCRTDTVIALNFDEKMVLIGNTAYAGENKKSVFTILNYLLPGKGVMAMHCSANHAIGNPVDAAVFFGLSGTGKTTLSADPTRTLIGDDEHGWSDRGIFNFEGGCYAKTINLSPEAEPEIYATTTASARWWRTWSSTPRPWNWISPTAA
jgi:phosphoenolpyruvate carboxykinase (ATP)